MGQMASEEFTSPTLTSASVVVGGQPTGSEGSYFGRRNVGLTTIATTPPPVTTPPTPDPNSYEKSRYNINIKDEDLDMLKEQVRLLRGLPATREKLRKRVDRSQPPEVPPRPTLTSRRRAELQQRRIIVRCSDLKEKYRDYDRMMESANSGEVYRQLRDDAMLKTNEELDLQFERQELDNLRALAGKAKETESGEFRDNQGSKLRFKHVRGEPIISGKFRDSYDDYTKPPFTIPRKIVQPKIYNLPKIDKSKEIWFTPMDDDDSIPLHTRPKSPDPDDKRSRKQKARPDVKPGTRTPASEWKDRKGQKPTKRPPWNFAGSCPPNIGWFK